MLTVLGAIGLLVGVLFVTMGPDLIEGGYEEQEDAFGPDERRVSDTGQQVRTTGWVVGGIGALLLLMGAGFYVGGRRPA